MPELPDVEVYRRYFAATSLHQTIEHVHLEAPEILEKTSPQGLGRMLKGCRFRDTRRHGKHLFAALDRGRWLRLHFGMTSSLDYGKAPDSPEHTRMRIDFCNSARLAYISPRKLGEVEVVKDVDSYVRAENLGPDALSIGSGTLLELLASHRGMVKTFLMNQHALAGLGNVYSDEILYQAKLDPKTKLDALDTDHTQSLHHALHAVLDGAVEAGADVSSLPDCWLLPHRKEGGRCPQCGGEIHRLRIAGRSAYYCPHCQPRPE